MINAPGGSYWDDDYDWNQHLDKSDLARIFRDTQKTEPIPVKDNSRDRAEPITKSAAEIIDVLFRKKITITENGVAKRVTIFDAIARQLYAKALSGEDKALQALILFSKFGKDGADTKRRVIAEYIRQDGRYILDCGAR